MQSKLYLVLFLPKHYHLHSRTLYFIHMAALPACMSVTAGCTTVESQKDGLDFLELELQMVLSHDVDW